MKRSAKKIFAWWLVVCIIATQTILSTAVFAQSVQTKRLAGNDRYKTAVAISQSGWANGSPNAIIARGDDFADALCAGPLAKKFSAPILLTQSGELNADTFNELKRLMVKNVYIVGGAGAVSSKVEDALTFAGIKVERIWGNDRFETSVKIAEKLGTSKDVVLATGENFPDALSISAVAAKLGMPILLTQGNSLPAKVKQYISEQSVKKTYVIGGTAVVSDDVKGLVPGAVRLGGKDRYETNTLIMQEFAVSLNFKKLYLAVGEGPNGNEFADALAGAVLAANSSSPLVLVNKTMPQVTANFLKSKVTFATGVVSLGGEAVVPLAVADGLLAYKKDIPVAATYDKAGTYGPEAGVNTVSGNVVISAAGVTLQNTTIEGDLLLAESIGNGDVTLKNITVKGNTVVNGGGPNSVIMYNFNGQTVVVDVPDGSSVRLVAQGSSSINNVEMESDGRLEESQLTGTGFVNVSIPEGAAVTLAGSFDTVDVQAGGANVNVESGSITNLNINAANAEVNLASGTSVTRLTANAPSEVTGTGSITSAFVASNGVSIQQTPASVSRAEGVTEGQVGGSAITNAPVSEGTNPSSGGGGGGGGGTPSITINSITVNASDSNRNAYGVTPSFDGVANNVVISAMQFSVTPADATLVIDQVTARSNNWLDATVSKAIPGNGIITTRDLLGDLDGGSLGINLGNLRKIFGSGNVVFTGHLEKTGYTNKSVTVSLTLGSDPVNPLPDTINTKWATLTKNGVNVSVTIKPGMGTEKLDTVGLLPGLVSAAVWPYKMRVVPTGAWQVGEAAIKQGIVNRTGKAWDQVTLDDMKGQTYEVQIIENSTIFNLTIN